MAQKKATSRSARRVTPADLRRKIEKLDKELVKAINERTKHAVKLAQLEADENVGLRDQIENDLQHVDSLVEVSKGPAPESSVRLVLRELTGAARTLVTRQRIAYLGPEHSYSHLAASGFFGESCDLCPVPTIMSVFEEVNRGQVHFGVVPLENSTDGRVADTLDMFVKLPVKICGEIRLRIHHYLLARCPRGEIREVYSKPQAMSQCRNWLSRHLAGARLVEMASTAAAAKLAAEKPGAAAIASHQAGLTYGLDVVEANIEDRADNETRFAVIGREPFRRTGRDKTSLLFGIPHVPGALADVMGIFKRNSLNLTWIESFPAPQSSREYLFFVEFHGHPTEAKVKSALTALGRKTNHLDILGAYPRSEPHD